jgi:hypothetical protein
MQSERNLFEILKINDRVIFDRSGSETVLELPAGSRIPVTHLQLKMLTEFSKPMSVLRVLAMAASDEERLVLGGHVNRWIELGILQSCQMDHGSTPLVTLRNPESSNIFFIYSGFQGGLMMNPMEFLEKSGLSTQNIVLLRDSSQTWFLNGVGEGIAHWSQLAAWQSGYLEAAAHVRNHYCLGSSMGAFSAIVFGHLLKAQAVWSFGLARTTVPILNERGEPWNLETLLSDWNGTTRYCLYFNDSWNEDKRAAMRLKDRPGVEMYPQRGEGHLVLDYLQNAGLLSKIFPQSSRARNGTSNVSKAVVTENEILNVLDSIVPRQRGRLGVTTSLSGILDSFGLVMLLERLSDQFDLELDIARLTAADFESAITIARAVARQSGRDS